MQQVKSYWRVVLGAGVVSAFLGAACTVTTSTDGGPADAGDGNVAGGPSAGGPSAGAPSGGASGSGTAGSGTAGGSTAGSGGTATAFICDPNEAGATGNPNAHACDMSDGESACDKCIRSKCCTEYSNCYATDPGNQCGWGGPNNMGEFSCYLHCLQDVFKTNGVIAADDKGMCAANCATSKDLKGSQDCGSVVGTATNDLTLCLTDKGCDMTCYGG